MRRLSVRAQLTLWFAACLVGGLAVLGGGLYLLFGRYLLGEVDRALEEEIIEVVREVRNAGRAEIVAELEANFGGHGFYVIEVSDPGGRLVFSTPPKEAALLPASVTAGDRARTVEVPDGPPHRLVVRHVDRPEGRYAVAVADSLAPYRRVLGRLIGVLAVLGPAAAGLSLFGGYWLARRALAPVDRLTQAALSITATDLHRRVADDRGGDEVARLAAAFNAMIGRLERAFEELRRFSADAAHELRTPLAVLRTGAEVALRSGRTTDDYRRALANQLDEIDRLSRLADQLLFLCREEAGFPPEEVEPVRLDLLLEALCETFHATAEARGLSLTCHDVAACIVSAPSDRVRRLFLNLLDNALRYTPAGGHVEVRSSVEGNSVLVVVEDDGPGIDPRHLPHVYERFYRGEASRNRSTGGSGLGLAICKSIVESLDGGIRLETRLPRGTAATVALPARPASDAAGPPERQPFAGDAARIAAVR